MKRGLLILFIFVITIAIVIGTCGALSSRNRYTLQIANLEDILTIEMTKDGNNMMITNMDKISDIVNMILEVKRVTKVASVGDYPSNTDDVIQLKITSRSDEKDTLYIYEKNQKSFIEKPYNGIYQIAKEEYDIINNYLSEKI